MNSSLLGAGCLAKSYAKWNRDHVPLAGIFDPPEAFRRIWLVGLDTQVNDLVVPAVASVLPSMDSDAGGRLGVASWTRENSTLGGAPPGGKNACENACVLLRNWRKAGFSVTVEPGAGMYWLPARTTSLLCDSTYLETMPCGPKAEDSSCRDASSRESGLSGNLLKIGANCEQSVLAPPPAAAAGAVFAIASTDRIGAYSSASESESVLPVGSGGLKFPRIVLTAWLA